MGVQPQVPEGSLRESPGGPHLFWGYHLRYHGGAPATWGDPWAPSLPWGGAASDTRGEPQMLGGSPGGPGELWGCSGCFWGAPLCAGGSSRCRGQPRGSNLLFGVSPPTHPGAALGVRVCFGGAPVYFGGAAPSAWREPRGSRETLGCTPGGWDWGFGAPQSAWGEPRGSQFALGVSQFTLGGHRGLGGSPWGEPRGGTRVRFGGIPMSSGAPPG